MTALEQIKKLRERTGAGIVDVKAALEEAQGDEEQALLILRKRGEKIAAKRADRDVKEGVVGMYLHANGKIGAMVALACETDFVARTDDFKTLARNIAMHVAAMQPQYLTPEDIPADVIAREKEVHRERLRKEEKPEEMQEKILEGKLRKFYSEVCLMNQAYVKDDAKSIADLLNEAITALGENIKITSFSYLTL